MRRAAPTHAIAAVARHLVPHLPQRLKAQIAQRAVVRLFAPLANRPQLVELLIITEQAAAPRERQIEPPQAQVIPPTLHQHRRKLARDHRIEQRQVLADQLFLQADRVRRNNDPRRPAADRAAPSGRRLRRRQNRRHEISEALADARPRLGHQMLLLANRLRDRLRHRQLLRPMLVVRQPRGNAAIRAQDVGGGKRHAARLSDTPTHA